MGARQPGRTERVADGRGRVPQQQARLQQHGELLRAPASVARVDVREPSSRSRCAASNRAWAPLASAISASSAVTAGSSRDTARSTSNASTLPEPSQIEFSGDSRNSRGSPDSST